jgi:hypothetical protein
MEDILLGRNLNEMWLTDFSLNNQFSVVLPSNYLPTGLTTSKCFFMVTIMDAFGATSNITKSIQVTRSHRLFTDYIITDESFFTQIVSLKSTDRLIAAGLESIL